jgi:CHAT domain-containing protein/tetratricopeptide (TPR) repeat protein
MKFVVPSGEKRDAGIWAGTIAVFCEPLFILFSIRPAHRLARFLMIVMCAPSLAQLQIAQDPKKPEDDKTFQTVRRSAQPIEKLESGTSLGGNLADGQAKMYEVALETNQYIAVVAKPVGIDISVSFLDPHGRRLVQLQSPYGSQGTVLAFCVASETGNYVVLVEPTETEAPRGTYELTLSELRPSREPDMKRFEAERGVADGQRQVQLGTADSKKKAVELYEGALFIWRLVKDAPGEAETLCALAGLYSDRGDNRKALEALGPSIERFRFLGNREGETLALLQEAALYDDLGDGQKAMELANQALSLRQELGKSRDVAEALDQLGRLQQDAAEYPKALEYYNRGLPLAQAVHDRHLEASILTDIGVAYYYMDQDQKALQYYGLALPLVRILKDRLTEAQILSSMGSAYNELGEWNKSLECGTKALDLKRLAGNPESEAVTLGNLGWLYLHLGEKQKAMDSFLESVSIRRRIGDERGLAISLSYLGSAYSESGDWEQALRYNNEALSFARKVKDKLWESIILSNTGLELYHKHNLDAALDLYQQSLPLKKEVNDHDGEASVLDNIGKVYFDFGDYKKARDYFDQALAIARAFKFPRWDALVLHNIALLELKTGSAKEALEDFTQAAILGSELGNKEIEASAVYGKAQAQRDLKQFAEAAESMEEALRIVESLRTSLGSLSGRASYFASVREYYEFYVDLLMQFNDLSPGEGFDRRALAVAERARVRSLLDTLIEARVNLREGISPDLLSREHSLQELLDGKASRQMEILKGKHTQDQAAEVKQQIDELLVEYQQVEAEIRVKSPHYAALTQPHPLALGEIQEAVLDQDSILLEYFLGEQHSYLWAVTKTSAASIRLPGRVVVEAAAMRFYDQVSGRRLSSDAARELSSTLLGGVASELQRRRLLIVSDGALQYIPFAALPDPARRRLKERETPLVVGHEIVMLPSASAVAVLRRGARNRKDARTTLAVLADPVYDTNDPRLFNKGTRDKLEKNQTSDSTQPGIQMLGRDCAVGMPRLTFSRREGRAIASLVPAAERAERYGFAANLGALEDPQVAGARYIHIASHGCLNREHAELSGLALSLVDAQGRPQPGILRLHQVYGLKLASDMVVLSACETALGKDIKGEGLVGLTQGFLYAGASRVTVSLWSVNDLATADLMKLFYSGILLEKLTPPSALRAAQIQMLKQKRWQSPFYWAPFVIQGEWRGETVSSSAAIGE